MEAAVDAIERGWFDALRAWRTDPLELVAVLAVALAFAVMSGYVKRY